MLEVERQRAGVEQQGRLGPPSWLPVCGQVVRARSEAGRFPVRTQRPEETEKAGVLEKPHARDCTAVALLYFILRSQL